MFRYFAYGLTIFSDIPLPGMVESSARKADVVISKGSFDTAYGDNPVFRNWSGRPGHILLELIGNAHILIENGNSILYQPSSSNDRDLIVSTIMGTGLAAIMLQRGLLPLHSCCVKTSKGALLVIGKSGAGKSTFLTGLLEHGLSMMADDVTAITLNGDRAPNAIPAFPAARLWQDACERAGLQYSQLQRVRENLNKFYLPITNFHDKPEPVAGVVWLVATNRTDPSFTEIAPVERLEPLSRFVYRKNFLRTLEREELAFRCLSAIAADVPMVQVERPGAEVSPAELAQSSLSALRL